MMNPSEKRYQEWLSIREENPLLFLSVRNQWNIGGVIDVERLGIRELIAWQEEKEKGTKRETRRVPGCVECMLSLHVPCSELHTISSGVWGTSCDCSLILRVWGYPSCANTPDAVLVWVGWVPATTATHLRKRETSHVPSSSSQTWLNLKISTAASVRSE